MYYIQTKGQFQLVDGEIFYFGKALTKERLVRSITKFYTHYDIEIHSIKYVSPIVAEITLSFTWNLNGWEHRVENVTRFVYLTPNRNAKNY